VTSLAQICEPEIFQDVDPKNKTNCKNCSKILHELIGGFDDILKECIYYNIYDHCSDMFAKVSTEDGACFTFNGMQLYRYGNKDNNEDHEMWKLEGGFTTDNPDTDPERGAELSLDIFTRFDMKFNDGFCKGPIQGFKVFLHLPNEAPMILKNFYLMPHNHKVNIKIYPKMTSSAPELRAVSVDKRQCYFSQERNLRFFRFYTQNNCELECVANMTLTICGCLRFHIPGE
jgi:acid-sensing ion channel, other